MIRLALAVILGLSATAAVANDPLSDSPDGAAPLLAAGAMSPGEDRTGLSLRGNVSTLGLGGELAWRVNDRLGISAPFGSAEMNVDGKVEGYDMDGTVNLGGFGLMVDFYPMGGAFHVSGGAFHTNYSAHGIASDVNIDGVITDVTMQFDQKRKVAPVTAMGWDWRLGKHGMVSADLGAIIGSGFDLTASESSGLVTQDRVDAETADIRDTAGRLRVLPYLKLGVGINF
ncbi:hypothetical protein [Oceanibium sediminis]|uniref:hypothetical protein n=1 Tax=Oceanibium sediminis TaxID=2026339 RepID=UPI000DD3A025|nr:hypothetical protein [Oceanibium sediminis]